MSEEELERLSNYKEQICRKNCEKDGNCFDCWTSFEDVKAVEHLLEEYKKSQQESQQLKEQLLEETKNNYKLQDELSKKTKEYQETYKDVREEIKDYKEQLKQRDEAINEISQILNKHRFEENDDYYDYSEQGICITGWDDDYDRLNELLQKYKGDNNE